MITMRRMAGPTAPLPSPSSRRATRNAQNSVAAALPIIARHGEEDPAPHEQRRVPTVGEAGQRELGDEPGEEPGGDDVAELRLGEAVAVAQVGEQRVDRAVPERHAPGDDAVGEQLPGPRAHARSGPFSARVAHVLPRGASIARRRVRWRAAAGARAASSGCRGVSASCSGRQLVEEVAAHALDVHRRRGLERGEPVVGEHGELTAPVGRRTSRVAPSRAPRAGPPRATAGCATTGSRRRARSCGARGPGVSDSITRIS